MQTNHREQLLRDLLLLCPFFRSQRKRVKFVAGFAPRGVVLVEQGDEAVTVPGFKQMDHLVNDDIFEQIFGLLHQFCVEADVAGAVTATAPLGFHSLQEITGHLDT